MAITTDTLNNSTTGAATLNQTTPEPLNSNQIYERNAAPRGLVFGGNRAIDVLRYPADTPKYYIRLDVYRYGNRDNALTVNPLSLGQSIILPLPKRLVDSHDVRYETFSIGPVSGAAIDKVYEHRDDLTRFMGDSLENQARTVGGFIKDSIGGAIGWAKNKLSNATPPTVSGISETAAKAALVGTSLSPAIGNFIDKTGVRTAIQSKYGVAPNRYEIILLQGPAFKHHTMSWTFSPRSADEAASINKIIRNLNNHMAPGLTFGGTLFSFPRIFKISFSPNPDYLYKFKPAILAEMEIDFSNRDEVPTFHKDSKPVYYNISMKFIELEYWVSGQFRGSMD